MLIWFSGRGTATHPPTSTFKTHSNGNPGSLQETFPLTLIPFSEGLLSISFLLLPSIPLPAGILTRLPLRSFLVGGWLCGSRFLPLPHPSWSPLLGGPRSPGHTAREGAGDFRSRPSLEAPEQLTFCRLYFRQRKQTAEEGVQSHPARHNFCV